MPNPPDLFCLAPQLLPPLLDVQGHGPQVFVSLRTHEQQLVTVAAPGLLDMDSLDNDVASDDPELLIPDLGVVVLWTCHNPTQDPYF